jgi:hypothetical protein
LNFLSKVIVYTFLSSCICCAFGDILDDIRKESFKWEQAKKETSPIEIEIKLGKPLLSYGTSEYLIYFYGELPGSFTKPLRRRKVKQLIGNDKIVEKYAENPPFYEIEELPNATIIFRSLTAKEQEEKIKTEHEQDCRELLKRMRSKRPNSEGFGGMGLPGGLGGLGTGTKTTGSSTREKRKIEALNRRLESKLKALREGKIASEYVLDNIKIPDWRRRIYLNSVGKQLEWASSKDWLSVQNWRSLRRGLRKNEVIRIVGEPAKEVLDSELLKLFYFDENIIKQNIEMPDHSGLLTLKLYNQNYRLISWKEPDWSVVYGFLSGENVLNNNPFEIISFQNTDVSNTPRRVYNVRVEKKLSKEELTSISNEIINKAISEKNLKVITIFYYLPNSDENGAYTAGKAVWAPDGDISKVFTNLPCKLVVKAGTAIGDIPEDIIVSLPMSIKNDIFERIIINQDKGMETKQSYKEAAKQFEITPEQAEAVLFEGISKGWPMPPESGN